MGGTSSEKQTSQTQNTTTNPYAPAIPGINSVLGSLNSIDPSLTGNESSALGTLQGNAQAGNPYASQIGANATSLLNGGGAMNSAPMVNGAYSNYINATNPTANGAFLDPSTNPGWQSYLNGAVNDTQNSLGSMYAAAGRDPSGAGNFGQNVGRGVAQGTAPTALSLIQGERQNQINAQNNQYQAGNTTGGLLGNMQNQYNSNQQTGANAAGGALTAGNYGANALLAEEAARRGIPLDTLKQQGGLLALLGQLGGTSNSTGNSTSTTSTPFNPLSLAPLALGAAFAPLTGGTSLAGMAGSSLFGGGSSPISGFGAKYGY